MVGGKNFGIIGRHRYWRHNYYNRVDLHPFGIEESFINAANRFKDHYHYQIGSSAVARSTKASALQAENFIKEKLSKAPSVQEQNVVEKMLIELDGCEIRTAEIVHIEGETKRTPVYNNLKKTKNIRWRDVRLGFVRPLDSAIKIFAGEMGSYQSVVSQMCSAAILAGMTPATEIVGVAAYFPHPAITIRGEFIR
jgi:hypothetical protein